MSKIEKPEVEIDEVEVGTADVIYLDTFTEVPPSKFTLGPTGSKTYQEHCGVLLKAGLLTVKTKDLVEMLAVADDAMEKAIGGGGNMRSASEMKRAAMLKLDKINADKPIAKAGQGNGSFSQYGFARRARKKQLGQD